PRRRRPATRPRCRREGPSPHRRRRRGRPAPARRRSPRRPLPAPRRRHPPPDRSRRPLLRGPRPADRRTPPRSRFPRLPRRPRRSRRTARPVRRRPAAPGHRPRRTPRGSGAPAAWSSGWPAGGGALLLILALGVVALVSGGAAVDEDAYTVYRGEKFRVEYPEEWRVYEDFGWLGDGNVVFESESRDQTLRVEAWYNTDGTTGAGSADRQRDPAPFEEEGSTEVQTGEARVVPVSEYPDHWGGDYEAARVTRTLRNDTWPTPERQMTVYGIIIGDEGFTLVLNVPQGEARGYEPVFERVVESFAQE